MNEGQKEEEGVQAYHVSSKTLTIMECLNLKGRKKMKGKKRQYYDSMSVSSCQN